MMKSLLKNSIIAIAVIMFAVSCGEPLEEETKKDLTFNAEVASAGFDGITINFTAGKDVADLIYFCGSQFRTYTADDFTNGPEAKESKTVPASAGTFTVTPDPASPAAIFINVCSSDGQVGKPVTLNVAASPAQYTVSKASLGSFVYTVDENIGNYSGLSFLAMSEETPEEWGMTAEELVDMYASFGMLEPVAPGESAMVELNGDPEHSHIIGAVYWDADYNYDIKLFNFKTGKVIEDAEKATINVAVKNITAESADLEFIPGEATCGYFYTLYKKADYNETVEEAAKLQLDPASYVRDLCAAGGSMNWQTFTDKRTFLSAGTDYVLVCYPYNVNGSKGWGESKIVNFTTAK